MCHPKITIAATFTGESIEDSLMRSPNPYLIYLWPPSPSPDTGAKSLQKKLEEQLVADLQNISNLYLIKNQKLTNPDSVADDDNYGMTERAAPVIYPSTLLTCRGQPVRSLVPFLT